MRRLLSICLVSLYLPLIVGCATRVPPSAAPVFVDLFIARSSLNGSEFEHYQIQEERLYFECGSQDRGKLEPAERIFERLQVAQLNLLQRSVQRNFDSLLKAKDFELPGGDIGLADPGKFILSLRVNDEQLTVRTNLDSVVTGRTLEAQALTDIAGSVRAFIEAPCGNKRFFGLP